MLKVKITRDGFLLALIMAIAGFLSFYAAWNEGYGNTYYAAAVQSMLTSAHNFFFASFDAGGYVSVDKPPLGLWIQCLSVLIFGFHGWSLILPQALATVVSTALLYHLVQRSFGKPAGLISALAFAVTPVVAAVSRTNNLDPILVMFLLCAAWALLVAAERGSLKLLLLSVAFVGLGFNVKMLQAFGIVPAIFLIYALSPALKAPRKVAHLALALVVLLVVSFTWAVVVDLTPADQRPYVGSSQTNSVLELIFGYNGIMRILPGGSPMSAAMGSHAGEGMSALSGGGLVPGDMPSGPGTGQGMGSLPDIPAHAGMMGPGGEGGSAGVFRLFDEQMAGQISWLLPLALLGFIAALLILGRPQDDESKAKLRALYFWGLWMLPMLVYFSVAGFFHRYYLITLAPPLAALVGIGLTSMAEAYRRDGFYGYLLPLALAITAVVEALILSRYPDYRVWLVPVICAVCLTSALVLAYVKLAKTDAFGGFLRPVAAAGFIALLIAPALWSMTPILYHSETTIPYAGPELAGGGFAPGGAAGEPGSAAGMPGMGEFHLAGLADFLLNNSGSEQYLVAVPNAMTAGSLILDTGKPVMAVGGFIGSDPILTVDKLQNLVSEGEVRYYLVMGSPDTSGSPFPGPGETSGGSPINNTSQPGGMMGPMPGLMGGSQAEITEWVKAHGSLVPASEWESDSSSAQADLAGPGRFQNMFELYDLRGKL